MLPLTGSQDAFDPAQEVVDEQPFEDDNKNRLIRTRLRKLGFEVLTKADYKAKKTKYELVLLS